MKVLVIGSGGREHAICAALRKSPKISQHYCAPGNGGIAAVAQCVPQKATDVEGVVAWAKENTMDFVVVAPDDPLALGMVDALEAAGIPAFGPRQNAAIVEASKDFSKSLMKKYSIPTVVKADGLALGKGVVVAQSVEEAKEAVREMMEDKKFGDSGSKVVIEECMTGPEVTVLAFVDGEHLSPMPASQDHKRAYDGNEGPNTGGMGAISAPACYTPKIAERCMNEIFQPTVAALKAEGRPFHGVLYFGLMLTPNGPRVVEYNARFGDPECQAVLSLLESDLLEVMLACRNGTLDQLNIRWKPESSCCLVLASGGYPGSYEKGKVITGLDAVTGGMVYHAGTALKDGQIVTNGGRVLGVTVTAPTLDEAIDGAYAAARPIHFDGMHFRRDIGRAM